MNNLLFITLCALSLMFDDGETCTQDSDCEVSDGETCMCKVKEDGSYVYVCKESGYVSECIATTTAATIAATTTLSAITETAATAATVATPISTAAVTATLVTAAGNFSQADCDALLAEHLELSMSDSVSDSPSDSVSVDMSISLSFDSAEFTENATLAIIQQFLDFCELECEMEYVGLVSGVDVEALDVVTCDCDLVECKEEIQYGIARRLAAGRIIGFVLILMLSVLY